MSQHAIQTRPDIQPDMYYWLAETLKHADVGRPNAVLEHVLAGAFIDSGEDPGYPTNLQEKFSAFLTPFFQLLPWHFFNEFIYAPEQPLSKSHHIEESEEWERRRQAAEAFFQPLEATFYESAFQQYLEVLESLYGRHGLLARMLVQDKTQRGKLPQDALQRLFNLLPLIPEVAGDLGRVPELMTYVLEEVVLLEQMAPQKVSYTGQSGRLGTGHLGQDTLMGNDFLPDNPWIKINIGPVPLDREQAFHSGGVKRLLLEWLVETLLPVEIDCSVEVVVGLKLVPAQRV